MYPVSEAFLRAVQENTRRYYWTWKITTKGGAVYPFEYEDIVKGSGYVSAQCCGSTEIELGTVYAVEMGVTLFSQIDRYTLDGAKISGYEDYKAGKLSRECFVERKRVLDARRQELSAAVSEAEAREIVEEAGQREYREAFWIREYLHLERYDKRVMASLIESAKVMRAD